VSELFLLNCGPQPRSVNPIVGRPPKRFPPSCSFSLLIIASLFLNRVLLGLGSLSGLDRIR